MKNTTGYKAINLFFVVFHAFTTAERKSAVGLGSICLAEYLPDNPDDSKNTKAGKIASDFTKSQLIVGQTYYLEYDKDRKDDYGRTLAYLWLVDCSNAEITEEYITKNMFNAVLLEEGYADTMKIKPNVKYAEVFEKIKK